MKKTMKKIENIFAASAFAEAGEFEAARQIMGEEARPEKRKRAGMFERLMMAVTFAEANEHETARDIMKEEKRTRKSDRPQPRKQMRA